MIGREVKFSTDYYDVDDYRCKVMTGIIQDKVLTSSTEWAQYQFSKKQEVRASDKYVIIGKDNQIYLKKPTELKLVINENNT